MNNKSFIIYVIFLTSQLCFAISLSAQKLPNKQNVSVWAPTGIKIDGMASEWNNVYQAYNKATEIYYTLSNDEQNLYLITYITSPDVLFYKAMKGVTLIVKNNNQLVNIRYPISDILPALARLPKGEMLTGKEDDPIIVRDNIAFTEKAKEIEVIGINGINNPISVYNEYGIKVAGRFDAKQGFIYELAIPLKYLSLPPNGEQTFSYQIFLNKAKDKNTINAPSSQITSIIYPDGTVAGQAEVNASNQEYQAALNSRFAPTDFAGTYTLAKKP